MTTKVSKKLIENQFKTWCDLNSYKVAKSYNDVGMLRLDNGLGGYVIELIVTPTGAITHPFGNRRRSATIFSEFLESIITYEYNVAHNYDLFKRGK